MAEDEEYDAVAEQEVEMEVADEYEDQIIEGEEQPDDEDGDRAQFLEVIKFFISLY